MYMYTEGALALSCLLLSSIVVRVDSAPIDTDPDQGANVVDLGYAKYQGKALDGGVTEYLGLRYAAPPLGELRWRAPQDPNREAQADGGPQDASSFGPTCMNTGAGQDEDASTDEDCLYVNVFAPSDATPESNLPVWFFIPGGGYAQGSDTNFNGSEVVRRSNNSIVFVNFNYRLGAFGFLASEDIRQNGDLNAGLLDQRKALEWVQRHIRQFGGNESHVVIHGDSAGAGSVVFHLTAYGARDDNLFIGAICESPFFPTHRTVKESESQFREFAANVACADTEDVMGCLRSKDTAILQSADVVSRFPGASGKPDWYFLPVIDGQFSTDYLYSLLERGTIIKVPMMVGDDTNEGTMFAANASTSKEFLEFMHDNYPHLTDSDLQQINKTYPLMPPLPEHAPWFPSAAAAYGDSTFLCPGLEISASFAEHVSPDLTWNYHYDVPESDNIQQGYGVPHVEEEPAIFGPGQAKGCEGCYETYDAPIVPIVMDYWISFVKTLDPNSFRSPDAPVWDALGSGQRLRLRTNDTDMESIPSDQRDRCVMWKNMAPILEQ